MVTEAVEEEAAPCTAQTKGGGCHVTLATALAPKGRAWPMAHTWPMAHNLCPHMAVYGPAYGPDMTYGPYMIHGCMAAILKLWMREVP